MNKSVSIAVVVLLFACANVSFATDRDGNKLLAKCSVAATFLDNKNTIPSGYSLGYCFGYLGGILDMNSVNSEVFCPPS